MVSSLSGGWLATPQGMMLTLSGALVAMVGVLGICRWWLRWQQERNRVRPVGGNTVEATQSYRRYLATAAWSGGSQRSWDHSVRPVLAQLVELAFAERYGSNVTDVARAHLGERLWRMVDRGASRTRSPAAPGPTRQDLLHILGKLDDPG